jgi:hypothetical protein
MRSSLGVGGRLRQGACSGRQTNRKLNPSHRQRFEPTLEAQKRRGGIACPFVTSSHPAAVMANC